MPLPKRLPLNIFVDHIIWFMLSCVLLVDTLTGYFLLNETNVLYSQLFKFCLSILLIYRVQSLKVFLFLSVFGVYVTFFVTYTVLLKVAFIQESLLWLNKFLLFILVFFFMKREIINKGTSVINKIKWVFLINFIVIVLNLLVAPFFGLGFDLYSGVEGSSKGFFRAGNEVGVTLVTIFSYLYFNYRQNTTWSVLLLFLAGLFILNFPTKVAILGLFLSVIYVSGKKETIRGILSIRMLIFILFFVCSVSVYILYSGLYDKFQFFFVQNGWWFLVSGRNFYVIEKMKMFWEASWIQQLFGIGEHLSVEMDFFDILINFGYFGLLLFGSTYWFLFLEAKKLLRTTNHIYALYVYRLMILLCLIAFWAGHVVFSAMAGIFIGIAFALMYYKPVYGR